MLTPLLGKRTRALAFIGLPLLLGVSTLSFAGTGTTQLNFTATFINGTCDIVATPGAAPVVFPPSTPTEITAPATVGQGIHPQVFDIIFSNCSSVTGLVPKLRITGNQITQGAGHELFRNATSTSNGYGVRLINTAGIPAPSALNIKHNDLITLGANTDNLQTKLNGHHLEFTAYLSCGNCTTIAPTPGSLNAAVTFDFLYN